MSEPLAVPAENSEPALQAAKTVVSDRALQQLRSTAYCHFASFFKDPSLEPYIYLLLRNLEQGHTCLPMDTAREEAEILPDKEWASCLRDHCLLRNSKLVSDNPADAKPFILYKDRLYLQRYFEYERMIAGKIMEFIKVKENEYEKRKKKLQQQASFIESLFGGEQLKNDVTGEERIHWQLIAALSAYLHNFTIITGGPGTGKTTTVAKVLALLYTENPAIRVVIAAPTGKAAVRLTESIQGAEINVSANWLKTLEASTIHSLLQTQKGSISFRHNASNPLDAQVVIIDESSMIDVALFAKLLDAIPEGSRVILLGDKNQLASVEAGSLFGDLCQLGDIKDDGRVGGFSPDEAAFFNSFISDNSRRLPSSFILEGNHVLAGHIVELKYSWRFKNQPLIGRFSKAVNDGDTETVEELLSGKDDPQLRVDTSYSEKVFEKFIEGYTDYLDSSLQEFSEDNIIKALELFNDLKILCAVREGKYGVKKINERVEAYLRARGLLKGKTDFYENQPIMVTRNNKALALANGDIGLIRRDVDGNLKAWFIDARQQNGDDGEESRPKKGLKKIGLGYLSDVETVFAMTIHKSQGSEYNKVLVLLPDNEQNALLTRELLYTGVTRAKKSVLIQGAREVILKATRQNIKRVSGIADRF